MKFRLAAAAVGLAILAGGCTLQYDRYGNPSGAGFTLAAAEEPTNIDRLVDAGREAAWLIDPKLGIAAGAIAGAFGLGKREESQRRKAAEQAWDESEARTRAVYSPVPTVNPSEVLL